MNTRMKYRIRKKSGLVKLRVIEIKNGECEIDIVVTNNIEEILSKTIMLVEGDEIGLFEINALAFTDTAE